MWTAGSSVSPNIGINATRSSLSAQYDGGRAFSVSGPDNAELPAEIKVKGINDTALLNKSPHGYRVSFANAIMGSHLPSDISERILP